MAGAVLDMDLDQLAKWTAAKAAALTGPPLIQALNKQLIVAAVSDTRENFLRSQDPDGSPWAALKARAGKPLLDKGILRASVVAKVEPAALVLSTNVNYAGAHQHGATIPPITPKKGKALRFKRGGKWIFARRTKGAKIPARPFLGFGRRFFAKADAIVKDFLDKLLSSR